MTERERGSEPGGADPARASRPRRSPLRLAISLLAAAALLAVVVWLADFDELLRRIEGASVSMLGLSLVAYTVTYVARARRFAAAGARASTWTLFWVVAIYGAANRLMPLRTGELSYPILARRVGAAGLGEGLVQVLMLRITDIFVMAVLFLCALALALLLGLADLGEGTPLFVAVAAALLLASLVALWRLGQVLGWAIRIGRRLLVRSPEGRVARLLDRASAATAAATELGAGRRARILGWTVVSWLAYFVTFHLILLALDVEIRLLHTVLGSSAAILGSSVPLGGLGTFGALEGGWTAGFVVVGLEPSTAASTAIVMSGVTLAFAVVLAAVGWAALSLGRRGSEAASAEVEAEQEQGESGGREP